MWRLKTVLKHIRAVFVASSIHRAEPYLRVRMTRASVWGLTIAYIVLLGSLSSGCHKPGFPSWVLQKVETNRPSVVAGNPTSLQAMIPAGIIRRGCPPGQGEWSYNRR